MRGYNNTAGINILGDCLPYDHNYLELSEELDGRGLPKPRIHFTMGENEQRMTRHADRLMQRIWEAAGARDIWSFPRNAHIIGTARMGTDPERSVVDPDGKAHDVPEPLHLGQFHLAQRPRRQPGADHHGAGAAHGRSFPRQQGSLSRLPSFLDRLRRPCRAKAARRPTSLAPRDGAFMFATGIECSYPTVEGGRHAARSPGGMRPL